MTATTPAPEPATGAGTGTEVASAVPLRASAVMAAGTTVSRVLGFARTSLLAAVIGLTGASADAFDIANTVPNALYMLVAGGVLNAVLVPQVVRASRQPDGGRAYTDRLLTAALAGLLVVTVAATAAAPWIVDLVASEVWTAAQLDLATAFAYWCLPQVFFYGAYTLLGQVLNARGSFGPYMWAPVVNNVVAITGLVVLLVMLSSPPPELEEWTPTLVAVLGGTSTLGIVLQAAVLVPALRRSGFRWRPAWGLRGYGLGTAMRVGAWTFAAVLVGQVGFVVAKNVTSAGGAADGVTAGNAAYTTAYLLFMLPHSVIAVSLATALFTRMSAEAAADDRVALRVSLARGVGTIWAATVAATAGLVFLAPEVTAVLFPGNSREATAALATVVVAMALGLPAFSGTYLVQRVFYAYEDARTPFLTRAVAIAVTTAGAVVAGLVLPRELVTAGVAAALTLGNVVGAVMALVLVRRRLGGVDGRHLVSAVARMGLAALVAGAAARGTASLVDELLEAGRLEELVALVAGGVVLLGLYLLLCRALRVQEVTGVLALAGRRLRRG